jgi:hypothetical protein
VREWVCEALVWVMGVRYTIVLYTPNSPLYFVALLKETDRKRRCHFELIVLTRSPLYLSFVPRFLGTK